MEQLLTPYKATRQFAGDRMLVLAPHPDDEVFGCGGAILRHVASGGAVGIVILTDGAYQRTPEYGANRRQESRRAAQVMGCDEPVFWGLGDRELEFGETLVQRIVDIFAGFRPDLVFAPSLYEMHPDHRMLGIAAMEAARRSPKPVDLVMYEVGVPMLRPNVLLDISDLMDRKRMAMASFASQLEQQAYDAQICALNCFRSYTLGPHVSAAEAYRIIPHKQLHTLQLELFESEYQRQRNIGLPMVPDDLPLVSVVILPSHQTDLVRALETVASQSYPHLEVILACDAPGNPLSHMDQRGRYPVRLVAQEGVSAPHALVNLALDSTRGRFVAIWGANDGVFPDHLDRLVGALLRCGDRAAYSGVRLQDHVGCEIRIENATSAANFLHAASELPSGAYLFDRSLLDQDCRFPHGPLPQSAKAFWHRIASRTTVRHVPSVSTIADPQHWEHALAALDAERAQALSERTQLAERVAELEGQIDRWRAASEAYASDVESLKAAIHAYTSSTSWRISAPIRWVSRLLRRISH